jgi:hypothetical protein
MHPIFSHLLFYLWIAPHALLGLVLIFLLRRKLRSRFPFFFYYCLFQLVSFLASFGIYIQWTILHPDKISDLYYDVLIAGVGVSALLEFAVLYEIANELILSSPYLARNLHPLLRWAAGASLLLAVVVSAMLSRPDLAKVITLFQTLALSANLIEVALLLTLLVFTSALGISWRSLPAGIALGLGVSAAAELGASALLSQFGRSGYVTTDLIRTIAFSICVLIWLVYVLLPERTKARRADDLQLSDLELQVQELQKMVRR